MQNLYIAATLFFTLAKSQVCLSNLQLTYLQLNLTGEPAWTVFHENLLKPLLQPRLPGTPSHENVRQFLLQFFKTQVQGWLVETDDFLDHSPPASFGPIEFSNLIFRKEYPVVSAFQSEFVEPFHLVLACHYDSKFMQTAPGEQAFLGATDSAVPCAILLQLALYMEQLVLRDQPESQREVTVELIFFDGEEAFEQWTPQDSIYGSRHLAAKWSQRCSLKRNRKKSKLNEISLFVLLDLIGSADPWPSFHNFFSTTSEQFKQLRNVEDRLRQQRLLSHKALKASKPYFLLQREEFIHLDGNAGIEDDHLPFLRKGVPILHLIPYPFPTVWHTLQDDESHLDQHVIQDLGLILHCFLTEILDATLRF